MPSNSLSQYNFVFLSFNYTNCELLVSKVNIFSQLIVALSDLRNLLHHLLRFIIANKFLSVF